MKLLTITAIVLLTSLAFAGDIEVSQAKDLQAEIQKLVNARKAAAVEALEQGKPKEAAK